MERLKERSFVPGSIEAQASNLLRGSARYGIPRGLKQRLRERLLQGRPRRLSPVLLRPALVGGCMLIALGALAAIGGLAIERHERVASPLSGQPVLVIAAAPKEKAHPDPALQVPTADENDQRQVDTLAPPAATRPPPVPAVTRGSGADRVAGTEPRTPSEAMLVYGAAKALHSSGNAELAAKLLLEYARLYPGGGLEEEALALSIDVAIARGDGRVKQLATRYLARYPRGHFQAKALRVLDL